MFNPYFALAGLLALGAVGAGGFVKGEQYAAAKQDQATLKSVEKAIDKFNEQQGQINAIDAAGAQREVVRQETVREITHEIPKVIENNKVVYSRVCIDGNGVRLIDRAVAAAIAVSNDPVASAGSPGRERDPDGAAHH